MRSCDECSKNPDGDPERPGVLDDRLAGRALGRGGCSGGGGRNRVAGARAARGGVVQAARAFAVVGEVLLYALQTCLGPELWTADVALAWLTVYSVMLETMLTVYLPGGGAAAAN